MNPKLIPALRQFCHNNGEPGFVMAYDKDIVDREFAVLERLAAPTAQQSLTAGGAVLTEDDEKLLCSIDAQNYGTDDRGRGRSLAIAAAALVRRLAAAPLPQVQSEALDAARYRWLRHGDNDELVLQRGPVAKDYFYLPRNAKLDEMIDARIADQQPVTPSGALADNDGGVA